MSPKNLKVEPIGGQRPLAIGATVATATLTILVIIVAASDSTPEAGELVGAEQGRFGLANLGRVIFTDYVWAFEIIAALLTIGVVGAVLLTRRHKAKEGSDGK